MEGVDPGGLVLARGRRHDPGPGVVQQDPDQLARGVSGCPDDGDSDLTRHGAFLLIDFARHARAASTASQIGQARAEIHSPLLTSVATYSRWSVHRPGPGI